MLGFFLNLHVHKEDPLFVLPPKSPKLNGHVERMQRTFRDEFYTRPLPSKIPELQQKLDAYLDHYNRRRPHRALNGLAPLEFLAMMQEESVPKESQMCWPTTLPCALAGGVLAWA